MLGELCIHTLWRPRDGVSIPARADIPDGAPRKGTVQPQLAVGGSGNLHPHCPVATSLHWIPVFTSSVTCARDAHARMPMKALAVFARLHLGAPPMPLHASATLAGGRPAASSRSLTAATPASHVAPSLFLSCASTLPSQPPASHPHPHPALSGD